MRIVVRYRRVRKSAAEPAFMRKIWRLGRIQKKYGSSEELKGAILAIDLQLKGVAMDPSGIRVKS